MNIKDHDIRIPAAYLKIMLQQVAAQGLPPASILRGTRLEPESFRHSGGPVAFVDARRILGNITRALGPGWHLSFGPHLTIPSHGPLGFAVVTAPNLRVAVSVLLQYFGIRGPFLWSAGSIEGDQFVIRFFEAADMGAERAILMELSVLSAQAMIERTIGHALIGAEVNFAHPEPAYRSVLDEVIHASVSFGAGAHALRFPAAWLDEPSVLSDEALHRYLLSRCEEEMLSAAGGLPAEAAVRQALLSTPGHFPGLSEIAAGLHVSPRTLIRRLKRGGTSYQAIRENVRKTLAGNLLLYTTLSVKQIAYRLGYQDASNFGRAFREWFGTSPGRFRSRGGLIGEGKRAHGGPPRSAGDRHSPP